MKIHFLKYYQYPGKEEEWKLEEWVLQPDVNLIVGRNASGKTGVINVLYNLSLLLTSQTKLFHSSHWEILFQNSANKKLQYSLSVEEKKVVREEFILDGETLLQRDESGEGKIWAEEVNRKIAFKIEKGEIAVFQKRDSLQHSFLDELYQWALHLRCYRFGSDFGKNTFQVKLKPPIATDQISPLEESEERPKVLQGTIDVFAKGQKDFGENFTSSISQDMQEIGFPLDSITLESTDRVQVLLGQVPFQNAHCLHIKERELPFKLPQTEISQGMFRSLALIIHLNYLQLSRATPGCILIDDIGEGLDYERATSLIHLLIKKLVIGEGDTSPVQLIMTTNDQFIMNGVPLDYWSVIERIPGESKIYNKLNSPEMFRRFEYTGLNNFDFFASNFYKEAE